MEHDAHTLPAGHALDLVALVSGWNVTEEALFRGLSLSRVALTDPEARIGLRDFVALIERARSLTGERALGFHLGMKMRVPAHGYLGFAALTAGTLGEALQLATRFSPTRTSALRLQCAREGGEALLYIDEVADFGTARDVILIWLTVGLWQIGEALTGRSLRRGSADFAFARPDYARRFEASALSVRFGQPRHCLRFDAALLSQPLSMANPAALQLARDQCERALEALDQPDVLVRVRELLPRPSGGFYSLEEVSEKLGVSARTLKRKLKAEGALFSDLLAQLAAEQAAELLKQSALSIEQVAERMGYSDVSNFGRAFRRLLGTTPAAYRKDAGR